MLADAVTLPNNSRKPRKRTTPKAQGPRQGSAYSPGKNAGDFRPWEITRTFGRRAGPSGPLESPARLSYSGGRSACFRRAASRQQRGTWARSGRGIPVKTSGTNPAKNAGPR